MTANFCNAGASRPITFTSTNVATKPYVKSLSIDGVTVGQQVITHVQIQDGADVVFEMSAVLQAWGSWTLGNSNSNEEKLGGREEQEGGN